MINNYHMHLKTPFMNNSITSISTMVAKYCKHAACFNTPATVISPDIYTIYTHVQTNFLLRRLIHHHMKKWSVLIISQITLATTTNIKRALVCSRLLPFDPATNQHNPFYYTVCDVASKYLCSKKFDCIMGIRSESINNHFSTLRSLHFLSHSAKTLSKTYY